ncbi:MAG TPA: type III pantothenate kinase [Brumimicrobium sp.]|nr:type III pantothenate kinase [Brumimicrobium sp.]
MIEKPVKYCVVDVGNTRVKVVDFENDNIVWERTVLLKSIEELKDVLSSKKDVICILSSVLDKNMNDWIVDLLNPTVFLNNKTALPIIIDEYETPNTLGADRIANAVAANEYSTTENTLVIDVGTCIKFDLVLKGNYQGGSIAPGYSMRLKAMHEFTGALPLLDLEDFKPHIGKSTKQAMLSGVNNGVQAEISGFIDYYTQQYQPLTIFLTGGDHKRFDKELKSSIFADDNLTVKGLYIILKHNV